MKTVFCCLATHVKDTQRTGTLHAAAGTADMQGQTVSILVNQEQDTVKPPLKGLLAQGVPGTDPDVTPILTTTSQV